MIRQLMILGCFFLADGKCVTPTPRLCDKTFDAAVTELNLSNCNFSGPFPERILTSCTNLEDLDLSDNYFSGKISSSFFSHPPFLSVQLQGNKLFGDRIQLPLDKTIELNCIFTVMVVEDDELLVIVNKNEEVKRRESKKDVEDAPFEQTSIFEHISIEEKALWIQEILAYHLHQNATYHLYADVTLTVSAADSNNFRMLKLDGDSESKNYEISQNIVKEILSGPTLPPDFSFRLDS